MTLLKQSGRLLLCNEYFEDQLLFFISNWNLLLFFRRYRNWCNLILYNEEFLIKNCPFLLLINMSEFNLLNQSIEIFYLNLKRLQIGTKIRLVICLKHSFRHIIYKISSKKIFCDTSSSRGGTERGRYMHSLCPCHNKKLIVKIYLRVNKCSITIFKSLYAIHNLTNLYIVHLNHISLQPWNATMDNLCTLLNT